MTVSLFTVAGQNNLDKGSEINDLSKGDNLKTIPVKVEKAEVQPKNMEKKEEVKKVAPSPVKGDNITEKKEVKEVDLTVEFAKMSMNGGVNGGLVDRQDKISDTEKELNTMTSNLSISDDSVKLNGEVKSRGPSGGVARVPHSQQHSYKSLNYFASCPVNDGFKGSGKRTMDHDEYSYQKYGKPVPDFFPANSGLNNELQNNMDINAFQMTYSVDKMSAGKFMKPVSQTSYESQQVFNPDQFLDSLGQQESSPGYGNGDFMGADQMFGDFTHTSVPNGMYGHGGMPMMAGQNDCMNANFNNNDLNNQMNNAFSPEQSFSERQTEKPDYSETESDMEKSPYSFTSNSPASQMSLNSPPPSVDSGYGGYAVPSPQSDIKSPQSHTGTSPPSNAQSPMPAPQTEIDNTSEYIDKNMDKLHDVLEILAKDLKDKDHSKPQYPTQSIPQENFNPKSTVQSSASSPYAPQQGKPMVSATNMPQTSMAVSQQKMSMNLQRHIPTSAMAPQQSMPNMYVGSRPQQAPPMVSGQQVRMQPNYIPPPQQVNNSCVSPGTPTSNQVIILPPNTMSQSILSPTSGMMNGHGIVTSPTQAVMKTTVTSTNQPIATTNSFVIVNNANGGAPITSVPVPIPAGGTSQQPNTIIIVAPQQPITAPKQEKVKLREIRPKIPGNDKSGTTNGVRPGAKIQPKPQVNPQMIMQRRGNYSVFNRLCFEMRDSVKTIAVVFFM